MFYRMRSQHPPTSRRTSQTLLMLLTPDGDRWELTVSAGTERFIGYYSLVPGLRSQGPLLEYQPIGGVSSGPSSPPAETP
jgi:hypothetical protein